MGKFWVFWLFFRYNGLLLTLLVDQCVVGEVFSMSRKWDEGKNLTGVEPMAIRTPVRRSKH